MASELIPIIKASAKGLLDSIVNIRRDLHQHPELSFNEKRTSEIIKSYLAKHGIQYTEGWAGYGVVATIRGNKDGPLVMLRADMDALPILEENDVPYRSLEEGIMHACGHDVHTSSLLGTAVILNELKAHIHGEIRLIFQPGEEKLPGGASIMIDEGLFTVGKPDRIIAQHVHPPLKAGHVGFRSGLYMASADEIYITIKGKGGHAATPHLCIDPIVIAARVVTALQEMISRTKDPMSPGVLTVGRIFSDGGATNVIPDTVHMEGTLRAMDEHWRSDTHQRIKTLVDHICIASGATNETKIVTGYPSLVNDDKVTSMCREAAVQYLGEDKVHELPLRMTSEDFAFYTRLAPASFYRLGTGWEDPERNFPVHSNRFDINEEALETGMGLMAFIALSEL
ncbi:MAG: amidohydrolase [Saprospiraceae bacterium]|nr:amidohydrolase [Candidatus Opimibacter iunctus]